MPRRPPAPCRRARPSRPDRTAGSRLTTRVIGKVPPPTSSAPAENHRHAQRPIPARDTGIVNVGQHKGAVERTTGRAVRRQQVDGVCWRRPTEVWVRRASWRAPRSAGWRGRRRWCRALCCRGRGVPAERVVVVGVDEPGLDLCLAVGELGNYAVVVDLALAIVGPLFIGEARRAWQLWFLVVGGVERPIRSCCAGGYRELPRTAYRTWTARYGSGRVRRSWCAAAVPQCA